jgi:hypothetical protein
MTTTDAGLLAPGTFRLAPEFHAWATCQDRAEREVKTFLWRFFNRCDKGHDHTLWGSSTAKLSKGGPAQTPGFWSLRCPEGTGQCCPLSPVHPCGARTGHASSNTASLTTANPQANSRGRAGPGYCASIQNDLNNCASLRGTAVPAVITGGTPVPQFMSLCIVEFLSALRFGADVEGVKTPVPEPVAESARCWDSAVLSVRCSWTGIDNRGIIQCKSR